MRGGERAWVTFWHFKSFAAGTVSVGRCIFHRHWVDMWPHAGGRERPPSCRAGPSFRTLSAPEAGGLSACLGHVCEKPDANSSFTSIRRFFPPFQNNKRAVISGEETRSGDRRPRGRVFQARTGPGEGLEAPGGRDCADRTNKRPASHPNGRSDWPGLGELTHGEPTGEGEGGG